MSVATCKGCDARWTGTRPCHCQACHQTFGGLTAFDAHQTRRGCAAPEALGLEQRAGIWRYSGSWWTGPES